MLIDVEKNQLKWIVTVPPSNIINFSQPLFADIKFDKFQQGNINIELSSFAIWWWHKIEMRRIQPQITEFCPGGYINNERYV